MTTSSSVDIREIIEAILATLKPTLQEELGRSQAQANGCEIVLSIAPGAREWDCTVRKKSKYKFVQSTA